MRKPYKKPVITASPDIQLGEPRISKFVIFLVRLLGRLYLFLFCGIARIIIHKEESNLYKAMQRSLAGKSRCIIAFRHPNGGEPQLMTWFFLFKLRALAASKGIKFPRWPHAVFVYSYEVVRYGGWVARYVMPNVGAMPIHHTKMDSQGMSRIYRAITEGPYPVALAPEGRVSYTTETIPRLEPGVVRIGFNAANRLSERGSDCPVEILPLSIYYHFGSWGKFTLEMLLKKIEKACGCTQGGSRGRRKIPFLERVRQCRDYILEANEARYRIKSDISLSFEERLEQVVNAALESAEGMLGIKGEGDFFFRVHKMRQLYWDRIYLPEVGAADLEAMTPIEKNITDLRTGEAWYIGRHLELLDFGWHFRVPFPAEDAPLHEKIEYTQNLWDFASRTMGGAFSDRVNIFPRKVIIKSAPPINLSERLPSYHKNKKAAIDEAMSDLEKSYKDCIAESSKWLSYSFLSV